MPKLAWEINSERQRKPGVRTICSAWAGKRHGRGSGEDKADENHLLPIDQLLDDVSLIFVSLRSP
ncbi:MAG: hypothetical protein ABW318_02890 [Vicinamibacterales bacterium]